MIIHKLHPGLKRRHSAFTLVEILLVAVLLAVIAGIAIPHLGKSFKTLGLKQAAGHMAHLMRYAQVRAILHKKIVRFVIEPQEKKYRLEEEVDSLESIDESQQQKSFGKVSGRFGREFSFPKNVDVNNTVLWINFYPDGLMDKAEIRMCQSEKCLTISTQHYRRHVEVY